MKRFILFFVGCFGLFTVGQTQNIEQKKKLPKEDIKVNKEYDEQGNLIRFDSIYTYNWSSDTTLINSLNPKDFNQFFGDHFSFFNDSSFIGKSFLEDFDQLFSGPFTTKRDSALMEKFGLNQFHSFRFNNDSTALSKRDFDEFFGQMMPHKSDSIQSKAPIEPFRSVPRSIDDMVKMMQKHMQQMEEMQQRFFEEYRKSEKQPKMKDL